MEGWIKLHRKFVNWEWFTDHKTSHLFLYLLLSANHEDNNWRGQTIKRGQLITGRKSLSDKTGLSEQNIRTCLDKLKSTNEITIKTTNKNSVITVLNYDLYQNKETSNQQNNQQLTNNQPTTNQQLTTNKNDNNIKNVKNVKKFSFRDSLLSLCNDSQIVDDYLQMRKTKRATNSLTAFNLLKNQFDKTGIPVKDILKICIKRDWKGFNADWLKNIEVDSSELIYWRKKHENHDLYHESTKEEFKQRFKGKSKSHFLFQTEL